VAPPSAPPADRRRRLERCVRITRRSRQPDLRRFAVPGDCRPRPRSGGDDEETSSASPASVSLRWTGPSRMNPRQETGGSTPARSFRLLGGDR
jgi:hypothetical protein